MQSSDILGSPRHPLTQAPPGARLWPLLRDLGALTKPRITAMVLLTEEVGAFLAPGHSPPAARWLSVGGTALIVGAANALNMWMERDVDGKMARTRGRPLPAGRLSPDLALAFALTLAALSLPLLFLVNATSAVLGLVALASYVLVYTPLKKHSYLALLVGAVPGAIPPLLGWCTVEGRPGLGGWLLFLLLFFWQVPHFAAITIFRAEDYARAGLQVVSVQRGPDAARRMIAVWTFGLVVVSVAFFAFGLAGRAYAAAALVLGAAFLALALRGPGAGVVSTRWARQVFALSIPYLVALLLVLLADRNPL